MERTALLEVGGLKVQVKILQSRGETGGNWGRIDVLITPVSGSGEKWVKLSNLEEVQHE